MSMDMEQNNHNIFCMGYKVHHKSYILLTKVQLVIESIYTYITIII
jgi:hypothetical protein